MPTPKPGTTTDRSARCPHYEHDGTVAGERSPDSDLGPGCMRYVALVLAVVLAGCGGIADSGLEPESDSVEPGAEAEAGTEIGAGTGGGSTSSIVTPAPVPAVSTPATRRSVAPGLTRSDVRNASLLADAHVDALSNTSYAVRQNVTRRSTDGRLRSRSVSVARLNGSRFRYAIDGFDRNRAGEPSEYRVERFFDGRRVLGATTRDGETTYSLDRDRNGSEARASVLGDPTNARAVERLFDAFEMRVAGTTERNGSTLYTVVTTRPQRLAPLANVTLRALVDRNGVIRAYCVSYTADRGDSRVDIAVRVAFTDLGATTVVRPVWYERAVENTTAGEL